MKTIKLLEILANNPHYNINLQKSLASQPDEIKEAFTVKDANLLRKSLAQGKRLANMSTVVQG